MNSFIMPVGYLLPAVEDADGRDAVVFNAAVDGDAVVRTGFLLIIVNVGVAGVSAVFLRVVPTLNPDLHVDDARLR